MLTPIPKRIHSQGSLKRQRERAEKHAASDAWGTPLPSSVARRSVAVIGPQINPRIVLVTPRALRLPKEFAPRFPALYVVSIAPAEMQAFGSLLATRMPNLLVKHVDRCSRAVHCPTPELARIVHSTIMSESSLRETVSQMRIGQ